jgi:hypothetical protein
MLPRLAPESGLVALEYAIKLSAVVICHLTFQIIRKKRLKK